MYVSHITLLYDDTRTSCRMAIAGHLDDSFTCSQTNWQLSLSPASPQPQDIHCLPSLLTFYIPFCFISSFPLSSYTPFLLYSYISYFLPYLQIFFLPTMSPAFLPFFFILTILSSCPLPLSSSNPPSCYPTTPTPFPSSLP